MAKQPTPQEINAAREKGVRNSLSHRSKEDVDRIVATHKPLAERRTKNIAEFQAEVLQGRGK